MPGCGVCTYLVCIYMAHTATQQGHQQTETLGEKYSMYLAIIRIYKRSFDAVYFEDINLIYFLISSPV